MFGSSSTRSTLVALGHVALSTAPGSDRSGHVDARRVRLGRLDARSSPPWASTMPRAIARPRPAPGRVDAPAGVGLERPRRRARRGMPGPSSATRISTVVAGRVGGDRRPRRAPVPGGRVPTALSSRLTKTCSSRSWSAQTGGSVGVDGERRRRSARRRHAGDRGLDHQARGRTSRGEAQDAATRCADESSRSPTRRPMRADSRRCDRGTAPATSSSHVTSVWRSVAA